MYLTQFISLLLISATEIFAIIHVVNVPTYNNFHRCLFRGKQLKCVCISSNETIWIRKNSTTSAVKKILISNCNRVYFTSGSIESKFKLNEIRLQNISHLILEPKSIYRDRSTKSRLTITIVNCRIAEIPTSCFKGISQLILVDSTIDEISSYALSSTTNMYSIRFFGTTVNKIGSLAFRKLSVQYLVMNYCVFRSLAPQAFSNLYVKQSISIMYSNFSNVKTNAFGIYNCKRLNVSHALFNGIEERPFTIKAGSVLFRNVVFSQHRSDIFGGLRSLIRETNKKASLSLYSVTFDCLREDKLKINANSFRPDYRDLHFGTPNDECQSASTNFNYLSKEKLEGAT